MLHLGEFRSARSDCLSLLDHNFYWPGYYIDHKRCPSKNASCMFQDPIRLCNTVEATPETVDVAKMELRAESRYVVYTELFRIFFAPNHFLQSHIAAIEARIGPKPPDIAVHVRRGNKLTETSPIKYTSLPSTDVIANMIQEVSNLKEKSRLRSVG